MSTIFPGNYVADLNAYRGQGVLALPGVEFYQAIGVAVVTENVTGGGSLDLEILSPDLRQDDKPRQDKPFIIPAGATVYRTAVSVYNLSADGTDTVAANGLTNADLETGSTLTAVAGVFPAEGATTTFDGFTTVSAESGAATITADYSGALNIVDAGDQACVLVEVCYFLDGDAPTTDQVHLPYKTEAGSGT